MQKLTVILFTVIVFSAGFLIGLDRLATLTPVEAAQVDDGPVSKDTLSSYKRARVVMNNLADMLTSENRRYQSATEGVNYFALSVGGVDAIRDLEEGRGVDPETFAGLYADRAIPEIAEHLTTDDNGRIRYKGNIVRLYSRERLQHTFRQREELENRSGDVDG